MKQRKKSTIIPLIPHETIESKILLIRDEKIMLDRDLARLYEVTTGNLNKAVKRNIERFPEDFMFQLTKNEADSLRFQFGSLKIVALLKLFKFKDPLYVQYVFDHGPNNTETV